MALAEELEETGGAKLRAQKEGSVSMRTWAEDKNRLVIFKA
jgi:hypothetical protein